MGNICPVCGKPLTIDVLHRVEELADRPEGFVPKNSRPFRSLMPLSEIISFILGANINSSKVWEQYNKLVNAFGSELNVLLEADEERMKNIVDEKIANLVLRARNGRIKIKPGYDGVYGEIVDNEIKEKERPMKKPQKSLNDF